MSEPILEPKRIAANSFEIIRAELAERAISLNPREAAIIERMIHSTADFDFAQITQFSPYAIEAGVAALRKGCPVVTDISTYAPLAPE